jgi:peptidoglycan/LPS O-acetylase OafA/YrhL
MDVFSARGLRLTPSVMPARDRLAFLDVARGLAALLVLTEHGLEYVQPGYGEWALTHVFLGKVGVLLFLVVSGFIIPVSLEQGGSNARFWLRRLCRLLPAYWLSILVAFACGCLGRPVTKATFGEWLLNLTMLQGFFNGCHVWGVFWTLQLELVIYASCSLLFALRLLRRPGWIAGLALGGYAAGALAGSVLENKPVGLGGTRFLYFAPMIGLLAQRSSIGAFSGRRLAALISFQGVFLLSAWILNHALHPADQGDRILKELAGTWACTYALFFILFGLRHWHMPPWACWLGQVSYSVYLFHMFVLLLLLPTHWPTWAFLPALFVATLALSAVTYRFVELPAIGLGRALERRWFSSSTLSTPHQEAPPEAPPRRAAA